MPLYVLLVPSQAETFQTIGGMLLSPYSKFLFLFAVFIAYIMVQVLVPASPWRGRQYEISSSEGL